MATIMWYLLWEMRVKVLLENCCHGSGDIVATAINIFKELPGLKIYSHKVEHEIQCKAALGFYVSAPPVQLCTVPWYIYGNDT